MKRLCTCTSNICIDSTEKSSSTMWCCHYIARLDEYEVRPSPCRYRAFAVFTAGELVACERLALRGGRPRGNSWCRSFFGALVLEPVPGMVQYGAVCSAINLACVPSVFCPCTNRMSPAGPCIRERERERERKEREVRDGSRSCSAGIAMRLTRTRTTADSASREHSLLQA
jgi:hypothetical protein